MSEANSMSRLGSAQPSAPRSAVDKAFDLLKVFRNQSTGLGVSEASRLSGIPKTTTHRLLLTLTENGALERVGDLYRLGPLPFELVSGIDNSAHANFISEIVTPFLASLFELTRHTVHLAYLSGNEVAYANKLFSTRRTEAPSRIGGRVPAYCTGVGKVLLAYHPQKADIVLAGDLPQWTPHTITDPEVLRQELKQARVEGIAYDRQEIQTGLSCVAAPVFGIENTVVAALSVSVPIEQYDPALLIPPLKRVCIAAGRAVRMAQLQQVEPKPGT